MKYLIGSIATAALLFVAVPGFACDGHAKAKGDQTTTAGAEADGAGHACAGQKDKKAKAACPHGKQKQAKADEADQSGES